MSELIEAAQKLVELMADDLDRADVARAWNELRIALNEAPVVNECQTCVARRRKQVEANRRYRRKKKEGNNGRQA